VDYEIQLYQRPDKNVVEEVVNIARLLTDKWFTSGVPEDTERDLLFQDAYCLKCDGKLASFIVFTCWDGSIYITLMATHPEYMNKGLGSVLISNFFEHIKKLGFNRIVVLTVPPDINPLYSSTVKFYEKQGFIISKRYNEIWQNGALELMKELT